MELWYLEASKSLKVMIADNFLESGAIFETGLTIF